MTFSPDPRKNPVAQPVVEKMRAKGVEPEGYNLYTYGAIQAWAQAAEKAGSFEPEAIAAVLKAGVRHGARQHRLR
jgi:branched-chain amino acid transport system substrate-binding protein